MTIIGGNVKSTSFGKTLKDGGAALIVEGHLAYASNEERYTRVKADGGYQNALEKGLEFLKPSQPYSRYLSSCCETKPGDQSDIKYVNHHLSHAALAFHTSGFSDALVIVADAGGNVLDQTDDTNWWNHSREQVSVFHAKGESIILQEREFEAVGACGFGELFRAFTHLLGWRSGRHAGKLMALAAFGSIVDGDNSDFYEEDESGKLIHRANFFDPREPIKTAESFLRTINREDLIIGLKKDDNLQVKADIAALVQKNLERRMVVLCRKWLAKLGTNNICLAGGVAMNCKMALEVRRETDAQVYVPPAANDMGQCVGNAIMGYQQKTGLLPTIQNLAFLGPGHDLRREAVEKLAVSGQIPVSLITPQTKKRDEIVAQALSDGEVVFWFQGRSEFGPRALGARSILADPSKSFIRDKLNKIKQREFFNPFAASCLFESSEDFFEDPLDSPYMTMAFFTKPKVRNRIPAVVHRDGTCRAQIFKRDFNPVYYDLIVAFKKISGLGLVLNTSLNGPGEPIIEQPSEALALFYQHQDVNILVLGDHILIKSGEWCNRNQQLLAI